MNDTNPVLCPVFFFLFVFFVFLVLLSMFVAIIVQAYITVKDQAAKLGQDISLLEYLNAVISLSILLNFTLAEGEFSPLPFDSLSPFFRPA